jgi:FtsP/CotA-like multicopper oxidase with cupredoxin domain
MSDGHHWTINGKSYPNTFELVRVADNPVSGIWKDVVVVPAWKQVEVDVPTTQPGPSLFHCHQQFHMDMGFMAMMRCSA